MISTEDSADQTLTWVVMNILEQNNDLVSILLHPAYSSSCAMVC